MNTPKFNDKPYTTTMIDISTGHLSLSDKTKLEDAHQTNNPVISYTYKFGFLIYVPNSEDEPDQLKQIKEYGYSDQFISLIKKGQEINASHIRFDADGVIYDDLKSFEW